MECKRLIKEVADDLDSELFGLHIKGVPAGESLTISRNWLTLGETVHPVSARPQSKASEIQRIKDTLRAGGKRRDLVFPFVAPH